MFSFFKKQIDDIVDYIKLESVQPLTSKEEEEEEQAPQQQQQLQAPPAVDTTLDANQFKQRSEAACGKPYDTLKTTLYNSLPIPAKVIPVAPSEVEILKYQNYFERPWHLVEKMTIREILQPFSNFEPVGSARQRFGKVLFLSRTLKKLSRTAINYDIAIICNSLESEKYLLEVLEVFGFNMKKISLHFENQEIYGLMVKIRKNTNVAVQHTDIRRNAVDMMFVFDSACQTNLDKEFSLIPGVHSEEPDLFYLASMDCADIRIHIYNRFIDDENRMIKWDTKVGEIDRDIQQILLLQPNRKPNTVFCHGWTDYLTTTFCNWARVRASNRDTEPQSEFEFKFPSNGTMLAEVLGFKTHHPIGRNTVVPPAPSTFKETKKKKKTLALEAPTKVKKPAIAPPPPKSKKSKAPASSAAPPPPAKAKKSKKNNTTVDKAQDSILNAMRNNANAMNRPSAPPSAYQYHPVFANPNTIPGSSHSSSSMAGIDSFMRPPQLPPSTTVASASDVHPDRMAMMMQGHSSRSSNTIDTMPVPNPENDLSSKGWKVTGSNASAMSSSSTMPSKRVRSDNIDYKNADSANAKKLAKTTTTTNTFQQQSLFNNQLPPGMFSSTFTSSEANGRQQAVAVPQQSPASQQSSSTASNTRSNPTQSCSSTATVTAESSSAAQSTGNSLSAEYDDFITKALAQFEADVLGPKYIKF